MTEQEYKKRIYEIANKVKTKKDLDKLLKQVVESKDLDYGKIVYAISGCMIATCNYINESPVGGITGFQASFIAWEMIKTFMHESEVGMRIVDFGEMLYPQCEYQFHTIRKDVWEQLQKVAKTKLEQREHAHPKVIRHWKSIVKGKVPFRYRVKNE